MSVKHDAPGELSRPPKRQPTGEVDTWRAIERSDRDDNPPRYAEPKDDDQ